MVAARLSNLSGSIRGLPGTGAVGLPGPEQLARTLAAHAALIICDQAIDEVCLTIHGERHYLWRAVAQDAHGLDILVQRRRNQQAAKQCFRKLLKGLQSGPRVILTDQRQSYGAAKRAIMPPMACSNLQTHMPQKWGSLPLLEPTNGGTESRSPRSDALSHGLPPSF
jgi:DDE domain